MNICERINGIKTEIRNEYAWGKLGWMLDRNRNVYLNTDGVKTILHGDGKYGFNIDEVKDAVKDFGNSGNRVNIAVVDGNRICGCVSIKKK